MLNFCKESLIGTEAVEALTLRWLASVCAPDATSLIRSENVAEWFISILPMKYTHSLFLWDMLPICNSPNAGVSKIRWTIAVKDDIDFLLLSFNVFLVKEEWVLFPQGVRVFRVTQVSQRMRKLVTSVTRGLTRRLPSCWALVSVPEVELTVWLGKIIL